MTGRALALVAAERRLFKRLADLEARLDDGGDDPAAWEAYCTVVRTLAALPVPGDRGELISTKQLAERLNVSSRTVLRRKARGDLRPAVQLGERGRAAFRWRADDAVPR